MPEPYELSVTEAAAAIARGDLSPVELVRSLLARIEALDPQIQAWETVDAEGALAQAEGCEKRMAGKEGARLLEGVPIGVKDIFYTAGLRTTASFPPYSQLVPQYDACAVARLREAGAIILGKTVTTQFAYSDPARTRNPWNLHHTPGGSSSGSGAAVAARMVPGALGTQTGGSVLRPAAYCGVVGFKPTFGRISRFGVIPLSWSLDHVGIIVRTVEDAARVLRAIAGYDPRDPSSTARGEGQFLLAETTGGPPRLGLVRDFLERAQPHVRAHVEETAGRLQAAGARIHEVRLPQDMEVVLAAHRTIMQTEAAAVHASLLSTYPDDYGPVLRAYVEVGQLIPGVAYLHAQRLRARLRSEAAGLLGECDALFTPTVSNTPPDPSTTGDPSFQAVWTLLGAPSITLPSGLSNEGLPFGIQLIAAPFAESRLFAAARWCQAVLGPMPAPPLASA